VARTIAQSESWVLVHLVIVVGLILMLGGLVALSRSIEGGVAGALAQLGSVAAVAGVTFILLALAVASSGEYPGWLGWVVVVAGVGSVPVGLVQAYTGESIGFTRIATIVFPTLITLWVAGMSVLILRKAASKGGRMS
jgi:hypothetical protein